MSTFWYHFEWPWPSFKATVVWEIKSVCNIFSQISQSILIKFSMLPKLGGLLKVMQNLFCTMNIRGRVLYLYDFHEMYLWYWSASGLFGTKIFQSCQMLGMMKLYSIISVWMTLTLSWGHRVVEKLELVESFCCEAAWSKPDIYDDWLHKEDNFEKLL